MGRNRGLPRLRRQAKASGYGVSGRREQGSTARSHNVILPETVPSEVHGRRWVVTAWLRRDDQNLISNCKSEAVGKGQ